MLALVTGGAGFIGSHMTRHLVERGDQVTVLDNLSTGKKEHLQDVMNRISFIQGDITDQEMCHNAVKDQQIIFHFAAHVSVPESVENPAHCFRTNVDGTFNLLEAARQQRVERFILASSSAAYGPKDGPCKETDICSPSSPYGYSKLLAEQLAEQYARVYDLHTISLRFFNVWGECQNPHGTYAAAIAKFKDCMKKNLPITIFGDGLQTRDFINVKDVIESALTMAHIPLPLLQGQSVNIATGKSVTLLELIEQLKQEFPHYTGTITFAPERPGDVKHSSADCSTLEYLQSQ